MTVQEQGDQAEEPEDIILSICIPTFNRSKRIAELLSRILACAGKMEVLVHDDGSSDDTATTLANISDARLRVSNSKNRGRAHAIYELAVSARGKYVMLFDDDDFVEPTEIERLLSDCGTPLAANVVGFIYHMDDDLGRCRIGSSFAARQANFMAIRADQKVWGDKKEVILRHVLLSVMEKPSPKVRRIPTSLYWCRVGLRYDVLCMDASLGRKVYLPGGMTANARVNKLRNSEPMVQLYIAWVRGFIAGRYRNWPVFLLSLLRLAFYYAVSLRIR